MAVCGRAYLGVDLAIIVVLRSEHVEIDEMLDAIDMVSSSLQESVSLAASLPHQCLGEVARDAEGVLMADRITVERPDSTDAALLKSESSPPVVRAVWTSTVAAAAGRLAAPPRGGVRADEMFSSRRCGQLINPGMGGSARPGLAGLDPRTGDDASTLSTDARDLRSPTTSLSVFADMGLGGIAAEGAEGATRGSRGSFRLPSCSPRWRLLHGGACRNERRQVNV